jgi:hypothetical protein
MGLFTGKRRLAPLAALFLLLPAAARAQVLEIRGGFFGGPPRALFMIGYRLH